MSVETIFYVPGVGIAVANGGCVCMCSLGHDARFKTSVVCNVTDREVAQHREVTQLRIAQLLVMSKRITTPRCLNFQAMIRKEI